jgi:hypothetical protein
MSLVLFQKRMRDIVHRVCAVLRDKKAIASRYSASLKNKEGKSLEECSLEEQDAIWEDSMPMSDENLSFLYDEAFNVFLSPSNPLLSLRLERFLDLTRTGVLLVGEKRALMTAKMNVDATTEHLQFYKDDMICIVEVLPIHYRIWKPGSVYTGVVLFEAVRSIRREPIQRTRALKEFGELSFSVLYPREWHLDRIRKNSEKKPIVNFSRVEQKFGNFKDSKCVRWQTCRMVQMDMTRCGLLHAL